MKIEVLMCPICGNRELKIINNQCKCEYCQSNLTVNQCEELHEIINNLLVQGKECDLKNLKYELDLEMKNRNLNVTRINSLCNMILQIVPEDVVSRFIRLFLDRKNYRLNYENYILKLCNMNVQKYEMDRIIPLMVDNCDEITKDVIIKLLKSKNLYDTNKDNIEKALKERALEIDRYYGKKDVFICHKSDDINAVEDIVRVLEESDCSCWYSERNLPFDTVNYWENIKEAIKNSKVFIFVLSNKSKLSHDCMNELKIAREYKSLKRIEYRIENVENNIPLKQFFNGIEWIDASKNSQVDYLAEIVYDILSNEQDNQEEIIITKEKQTNVETIKFKLMMKDYKSAKEDVLSIIPNDLTNPLLWELLLDASLEGKDILNDECINIYNHLLEFVLKEEKERIETKYKLVETALEKEKQIKRLEEIKKLVINKDNKAFNALKEIELKDNIIYQNLMGRCYLDSIGVQQNCEEALKWLELAANQGCSDSQNLVGIFYRNGIVVSQNHNEAYKWFKKSADQGNHDGLASLGMVYDRGEGVEQNHKLAFKYMLESAKLGNGFSQNYVGFFYEFGLGVTKDIKEAIRWYQEAINRGYNEAKGNLERAKQSL